MVRKKTNIILLSIIAVLAMSAVSMFVYGCFCLNKKKNDVSAVVYDSGEKVYVLCNNDDCVLEEVEGAGEEMGWSSGSWAWVGNDDYGLPNGLPVPAVFMPITYTLDVDPTGDGDGNDDNFGGYVKTGQTGHTTCLLAEENAQPATAQHEITFRVFKDFKFGSEGINVTNLGAKYANSSLATGSGDNLVFEAVPYGGYRFKEWTQSGNTITAHFERLPHEVFYVYTDPDNSTHHISAGTGNEFTSDSYDSYIADTDRISAGGSFIFEYGDDASSFKFTSIAESTTAESTTTNTFGAANYYVSGWEYATVTKYVIDANGNKTLNSNHPDDKSYTPIYNDPEKSEDDTLSVSKIITTNDTLEHRIYLRPIWSLKTYSYQVTIAEDNSKCGCEGCNGGEFGEVEEWEDNFDPDAFEFSINGNLTGCDDIGDSEEVNIQISTDDETRTISGIPAVFSVNVEDEKVSVNYDSEEKASVTTKATTGHEFSTFDAEAGEVTMTYAPIEYHVSGYDSPDSAGDEIDAPDLTTEFVSPELFRKNNYVCGSSVSLTVPTGLSKTFNGADLYYAAGWKIGPFNGNSLRLGSGYTATIDAAKKTLTLTLEEADINIIFKYTDKLENVNLYGDDNDYDGDYYLITSVEKGSYGNLNVINDWPVITPYWVRTEEYLLYYNNETTPTFHTQGNSGSNGYNVTVSSSNLSEMGPHMLDEDSTEKVIVRNDEEFVISGLPGNEGSKLSITIGGDTIEYSAVAGYKFIGLRYILIGSSSTENDVETATNWVYYHGVDNWGTRQDLTNLQTLNPSCGYYAIAIQPIVELIQYTATFTVACKEHSTQHHGGYFTTENIGAQSIKINEKSSVHTEIKESKANSSVNSEIEYNQNEKVEITIDKLVYGMTYLTSGSNLTFKYLGDDDLTITANGGSLNGCDLYSFDNGWSSGSGTISGNIDNITATFDPIEFTTTAYYHVEGEVPDATAKTKSIESTSYYYCDVENDNIDKPNDPENMLDADNKLDDYFVVDVNADNFDELKGILYVRSGVTYTKVERNASYETSATYYKHVEKYFDGWQIGPFNSDNYFKHNTYYKADIADGVLTLSKTDQDTYNLYRSFRIQLNLASSDTIVDINGDRYYLLKKDSEIKGYNSNKGNYGLINTIKGVEGEEAGLDFSVITARWANVYDLRVLNDGGSSIWNPTNGVGKDLNNEFEYLGIEAKIGGTDIVASSIDLKIDNRTSAANNYKFITNQNFAFYTKDDKDTNNTSELNTNNWFAIYNYGYRLTGWRITFANNGTKYVKYESGNWSIVDSLHTNEVSVLTSATIGGYAGMLDNLYTAGLSEEIYLTISPVWEQAKINVYQTQAESNVNTIEEKLSEGHVNNNVIQFAGGYTLSEGHEFDGTTFAMYKVEDINGTTDQPIRIGGIWNYHNIPHGKFTYVPDTGTYDLDVTAYSVSNIYKITLAGVKVTAIDPFLIDGSSYSNTVHTHSAIKYTFKTAGVSYVGSVANDYGDWNGANADLYWNAIQEYVADIDDNGDPTHTLLRKIYGIDSENPYIYLAHGYETGVLPAFDHENYRLIYWYNSDAVEDDKTSNIYHTPLFNDPDRNPGYDADANGRENTTSWSFNGENTTFTAHYFRKYYFINPEIVEEDKIGQVGYLIIDSIDQIEVSNDTNRYEGTYLAIALKSNPANANYQMYYYDLSGVREKLTFNSETGAYESGFTLENLTIDQYNLTKLTYDDVELTKIEDENGVKIYSGCDLNISIFDQSQDPQGMASDSGKFDSMIGHKFSSASAVASGNAFNGYALSDYDCDVNYTNDSDPIGKALYYTNGESITFTFEFVKLEYNLIIELDDYFAGALTISRKGSQIVDTDNEILTQLKVGDTITIKYNATLGYDLENGAIIFDMHGDTDGLDYTLFPKVVDDFTGMVQQTYTFDFNGEWLRKNYYKPDTGNENYPITDGLTDDDADGIDLGTLEVKTELIEFNYVIKLIDTQGDEVGFINGLNGGYRPTPEDLDIDDSWDIEDRYMSIEQVVEDLSTYGTYGVKFNEKEYAMIKHYFNNIGEEKYPFPLSTDPVKDWDISSNLNKLYNYGTTIIPDNVRTINTYIVVEPIQTITLKIAEAEDVANLNLRIYNNSNNLALKSMDLVKTNGEGGTEITIPTYKGLENSIEIKDYNEILYSGVKFAIGGVSSEANKKGSTYKYISENSSNDPIEMIVSMEKANHRYVVDYYVNGNLQARPDDLLADTDLDDLVVDYADDDDHAPSGYARLGDSIVTSYKVKDGQPYVLSIKIATTSYDLAHNDTDEDEYIDPIEIIGQHLNNEYIFHIEVHLTEYNNNDVLIVLQLADSSQSRDGDDYGDFDVYVDGAIANKNIDGYVRVHENKSLSVGLNLNDGYRYSGQIKVGTSSPTEKDIVDGKLVLTENYTVSNSKVVYYILIEKIEYDVVWQNSDEENYNCTTQTGNSKVIVGDKVQLNQKANLETEKFIRYFYRVENTIWQEISSNPNCETIFTFDKLYEGKFYIKVETRTYYKLEIRMNNNSKDVLKVDGGVVFSAGIEMDFDTFVVPLNREVYAPEGEIDIEFETKVAGKYQAYYKVNSDSSIAIEEDGGIYTVEGIEFGQDAVIEISIEPRTFGYSWAEIHDGDSVSDEDKIASPIVNGSMKYGQETTIELLYLNDDYMMTYLCIEGNDTDKVEFSLSKGEVVETNPATSTDYIITISGNKLTIKYTVANNIALTIGYTSLININPAI